MAHLSGSHMQPSHHSHSWSTPHIMTRGDLHWSKWTASVSSNTKRCPVYRHKTQRAITKSQWERGGAHLSLLLLSGSDLQVWEEAVRHPAIGTTAYFPEKHVLSFNTAIRQHWEKIIWTKISPDAFLLQSALMERCSRLLFSRKYINTNCYATW